MSDKTLYSYTGLFDTPDEIIKAANQVAEDGYKKFDVNTPYPVHGMDKAMKLGASPLGYVALVLGLSGTLLALGVMYWMVAVDYPVVIGGKPFFAFPAFVPIMFEVTVLLASVGTVLVMLFILFKLPNNAHPLHDTDYMKATSCDKYGISIQADDPKFEENTVKEYFSKLGAKNITPIYYDEKEINTKHKVLEPKFIGFLIVVFIIVSGATYFSLNKLIIIPPFSWMMEQEKVVPQESSSAFENGRGMRQPVQGTVARGLIPYAFKDKPEEAGKFLINPLSPTEETLALGKKKFEIYCSPCHGNLGKGDSMLRGQFPNPPSLHSEKARQWPDGRVYHIITEGQNVMPGYSSQLSRRERWAIVLYIRALQRSQNAKESDLL
ncbi:MAG: DUF3341 domain-containing protein [Ignavibacteria bacterium]|jgi:mono/diheme cytochrome c family protein